MKEYYDIAVERTKLAMEGKLKTRPMNKPIYDPKNPKLRVCPKIITTHKYENMIYSKDGNRNSDTREILVIKNTSG
ncbi:MAG: hypothetical protein LBP60_00875, partial [Spirochaetaceae bacterium]|nr:hypothetical protein [Spirochaetaceae bacterium]